MNRRVVAAVARVMLTACAACATDQTDLGLGEGRDSRDSDVRARSGLRHDIWPSPGSLTLRAGTHFHATWGAEVTSGSQQAGETVALSVNQDVVDVRGRVVMPAGSTIYLLITRLVRASSPSQADGKFDLSVRSASIRGQSYDLLGYVTSVPHSLQDSTSVSGGRVNFENVVDRRSPNAVIDGVVVGSDGATATIQAVRLGAAMRAGARVEITLTGSLTVWVR